MYIKVVIKLLIVFVNIFLVYYKFENEIFVCGGNFFVYFQ